MTDTGKDQSFRKAQHAKPLVGVGSCLIGEPVRFNGAHKRQNPHIENLRDHMELQPICPEVGIGLGVPREPIRLVEENGDIRAKDSNTQTRDVTDDLRQYAQTQLNQWPNLCGYILVKGSPSCGFERVSRYNADGKFMGNDSSGVYTQQLLASDPLLPVEEDGRLHDAGLRESFISRIYVYHEWKRLLKEGLTLNKLIAFYADHKYLVMAHSVPAYQELGPLVANAKARPLNEVADEVIHGIMSALTKVATRRSHTNVLQHLQGYLKNHLSKHEKQELQFVIEQYRTGIVPLITPMTLLQHHFRHSPDTYINRQVFMQPYPESLALRSHLN